MKLGNRTRRWQWLAVLTLALLVTACDAGAEAPLPTREPAPTFTPTVPVEPTQVDPTVAAEIATAAAEQPVVTEEGDAVPVAPADDQPAEVATLEAPATETPAPEPTAATAPEVVINTNMNVRNGPGTNYGIIGAANQGQRYPVTGKNQAGDWWQIDFNGQTGWVFGQLVTPSNTQAVALASNIPEPPPPPPPTNTPVPPAPEPQPQPDQPVAEEPAPQPSTNYEFNRAILQRCAPNAGVTYVEGTVYKNSQPVNGYNVVFSYAPDGPIVASVRSGPHAGYTNWNPGYYSHILSSSSAREGNWFFWITDGNGTRISAIANVQTDGTAGDGQCQQAVIDFDS